MRADFRGGSDPNRPAFEIGFRVVQIPEPGSFALQSIGGLVVVRRRRER